MPTEAPAELELADQIEALQARKTALAKESDGRSYTEDEKAEMKQIVHALNSGDEEKIRAAHAAITLDDEPATPADELATAAAPDRPEGAADDEPANQEEREATADYEPEEPTATTAEEAARYAAAAGVSKDGEQAALEGELAGYVPGESNGEHVEGPEPSTDIEPAGEEASGELVPSEPQYDVKVWQKIVGGHQPDDTRVTINSLPSLHLENVPDAGLKKGDVVELRVTARVTGYAVKDALKFNLETQEIELKGTPEKRTLTVTDAWIV